MLNESFLLSRDGSILVWSCGQNRKLEPELKVDETLTCVDIFDDKTLNAHGDGPRESETEGLKIFILNVRKL
jgi:hypothetical protein